MHFATRGVCGQKSNHHPRSVWVCTKTDPFLPTVAGKRHRIEYVRGEQMHSPFKEIRDGRLKVLHPRALALAMLTTKLR